MSKQLVNNCRSQKNRCVGRTTAMHFYAYCIISRPPKRSSRRFERRCEGHGSDEEDCESLIGDAFPFPRRPSAVISVKLRSLSFIAVRLSSFSFIEITITKLSFVAITTTSFTLIVIKLIGFLEMNACQLKYE